MRNGSPVFHNVVHVHNLRDDNVIEPEGRVTQNFFYRLLDAEHLPQVREISLVVAHVLAG